MYGKIFNNQCIIYLFEITRGNIVNNCPSCGTQTNGTLKFCQDCGAKLPTENNAKLEKSQDSNLSAPAVSEASKERKEPKEQKKPKQPKKPMSIMTKVLIGVTALLLVALGASHIILQKHFDPFSTLEIADDAFNDEDYESFVGYFTFPENTYVDAEVFLNYMENNEWDRDILPQFEDAFEDFKNGYSKNIIIKDRDGNRLCTIIQNKVFGLYKDYQIEVEAIEVFASTDIPKANLTYGKEESIELTNEESKSLGLFAPGTYSFDITLKDDIGSRTETSEQLIYDESRKKRELNFNIDEMAITFTSDYEDAIVFIDSKPTNKKANEIVTYTILPDGNTEVYAEYTKNGDKMVSDVITIDSNEIHIPFSDVQEKKRLEEEKKYVFQEYNQDIRNLYENFRNDYYYAVNDADFYYIKDYFETASILENDYKAFVEGHQTMGYYSYDFISNTITDIYAVDGSTISLKTNETFYFYSDVDGNWYYDRDKLYTVKIIDGYFKIISIEDIGSPKKTKL